MTLLILGIALVVIYDFTNGFHDAADMIATAIASRSIKPFSAILIVTFFTFLGPFIGGVSVANTIGELIHISDKTGPIIYQFIAISAVLTAISYNLITWKFNLPSSSSNSLAGGLIGAALYAIGPETIDWGFHNILSGQLSGFIKVLLGIFLSPMLGFLAGFIFIQFFNVLFKRLNTKAIKPINAIHTMTIATLALSHGANDAQKGMGIIGMFLLSMNIYSEFTIPIWVILLCASSITLGTLFGGWGIIKTVGFGIYRVKLIHSFTNQLSSSFVILLSSAIGAPTSTTQVVTTSLAGIGSGERPKHVKWNVIISIFKGWIFNIPISVLLGMLYCFIIMTLKGRLS